MGEKKDNKFMSMFPVRTNQTLALSVHSFESQHHTNTIVRGLGENAPKTLAGCSFPNKTTPLLRALSSSDFIYSPLLPFLLPCPSPQVARASARLLARLLWVGGRWLGGRWASRAHPRTQSKDRRPSSAPSVSSLQPMSLPPEVTDPSRLESFPQVAGAAGEAPRPCLVVTNQRG